MRSALIYAGLHLRNLHDLLNSSNLRDLKSLFDGLRTFLIAQITLPFGGTRSSIPVKIKSYLLLDSSGRMAKRCLGDSNNIIHVRLPSGSSVVEVMLPPGGSIIGIRVACS